MGYDDDFLYDYDGFVDIYIDGACSNNGRQNAAAGFGVVFNYDHPSNHIGPVKGRATNNAGEIQAATWAINEASDWNLDEIRLYTDSMFLVNAVNKWMDRWKHNGWRRSDGAFLANKKDFQFLDRAIWNNQNMTIEFEHIPGHSGNPFNELADELARRGAKQYFKDHYC